MNQESVWQLRFDLAVALALLTVAKAVRPGNPNPDVCFYLGDRYWCLAEYCKERGSVNKAQRLRETAERYLQCSGPWRGPPHAAAMAMPVPRRPTFTQAIGWRTGMRQPPDDAA
ncbi:MAG: hypothetical protein E6J54_23215 [Deltaproteobacteria bacterium]|nr:MAG: hypothetical protein E6J54_23215 [Deltaproteobacteria bacterium]